MPPPSPPTTPPSLPTLPLLSTHLASHLPTLSPASTTAEVPWLYHSPHPPHLSLPLPTRPIPKLILSITPTPGVYAAASACPPSAPPALFLHRPWALDRGRLPRGSTVWASHKAFDEGLTVGANFALLAKLGFEVQGAGVRVLVGYKGDAGRRVGVVARAAGRVTVGEVRGRVEGEFGGVGEGVFGFEERGVLGREVGALACMNAFHPEEVERVAAAVGEVGGGGGGGGEVVYLTGAVREEGLRAARERGMLVICVGHRVCESWGIGYLAGRTREAWPGLEVVVVDDEEEIVPKKKKEKGDGGKKGDERRGVGDARRGEIERLQDDVDDGEEGGVAL